MMNFLKRHWGKKYRDEGLLVMRIGLGVMFMFVHGWPKLVRGPEIWARVGSVMPSLGIPYLPECWGLMAALAEFLGGFCLIMGWMFRPAVSLLVFTMLVASLKHLSQGDGWGKASHAIELLFVFVGLLGIGAGAHSLDGDLPYKDSE